ncbi:MAG: STAS domain-containing protein [Clostridia bacterium]|nr:STAS domain-containing protein [Clostridia bacterium]
MQEVTIIEREPKLVVCLKGEIDSGNADAFYESVMQEYRLAPKDVVFDCEALSFIDSTTLGTFVKVFKQVRTDGFTMKLVHTQPRIKKLFLICKLDTIMEIA